MQVEEFLSLLKGVRSSGHDRWNALCPSHSDRNPSLAVTRGERVPILLHCFAGCDVGQIVSALGLELSDLMPEPQRDGIAKKETRARFTAVQALRCLSGEATFLCIVASDLAQGKPITRETKQRIVTATGRINEARRLCNA